MSGARSSGFSIGLSVAPDNEFVPAILLLRPAFFSSAPVHPVKASQAVQGMRSLGPGQARANVLENAINQGPFNFTPSFSRDGKTLWYASTASCAGQEQSFANIYVAQLPANVK